MHAELLTKALIAFLPVILLVVVLYRLDSHRLLGTRFMLLTFVAGAAIAVLCAYLNAFFLDRAGLEFTSFTRYAAPLIEESLKAAFVVYLFRTHRIGFMIDAGIIGFTLGAGFSLAENGFYLHHASEAHYGVWLVRGFGTSIMHGGATALFAIVAEVMTERHRKMNAVYYLPGLVLAVLLHSVFNHFPVSPVLSTVVTLLILPTILFILFERNEATIHRFLELDYEAHRRLLDQIRHGEFSGCEAGRFLRDMQKRMAAPVVNEMIEYFRLHTELTLNAERILLAREEHISLDIGEEIHDKLKRMHELESHIGRAGLITLRQHLDFTAKDMWEIHLLEQSG
jgi:RsiW-degrading membrane proteinase PrsW (M82 family)